MLELPKLSPGCSNFVLDQKSIDPTSSFPNIIFGKSEAFWAEIAQEMVNRGLMKVVISNGITEIFKCRKNR